MDNKDVDIVVSIILVCAFILGALTGGITVNNSWQRDAIKHGVGQYNNTTAQFEWIITEKENSKNEQTE